MLLYEIGQIAPIPLNPVPNDQNNNNLEVVTDDDENRKSSSIILPSRKMRPDNWNWDINPSAKFRLDRSTSFLRNPYRASIRRKLLSKQL